MLICLVSAPLVARCQLSASSSEGGLPVPELWGIRVHDDANVLKHETIDLVEHQLEAHEDSTGNQIAILIINSLRGENLEEYALKVATKWELGDKVNENGVLLLVAIEEHAIRIEVERGLEGTLTDAMSSRIIRNEIAPAFRRNDYDTGIIEGTQAIVHAIKGEYVAEEEESLGMSTTTRILIGIFIFIALGTFTWAAMITDGGAGWGLYAFLILFYAAFPWIVLGFTGAVVLLIIYVVFVPIFKIVAGRSPAMKTRMKKWRTNSRAAGGRTWTSGRGFGGGFSSGGSRGGGFSGGGGGGFRGGGASGGW